MYWEILLPRYIAGKWTPLESRLNILAYSTFRLSHHDSCNGLGDKYVIKQIMYLFPSKSNDLLNYISKKNR